MNPFILMMKCGWSLDEAIKKAGRKPTREEVLEIQRIDIECRINRASINERKYSELGDTAEDRIIERIHGGRKRTYDTIQERHLCGVGECRTNKGVIRRIKYGNGSLSKRGYLKKGFGKDVIDMSCKSGKKSCGKGGKKCK